MGEGGKVVLVPVVGADSVAESSVVEVEEVVRGGEKAGLELWIGVGVLVTTSDVGMSGSKDEVKPLPISGEDVGRSCIAVVVLGAGWAEDSMGVTEGITEELL